MYLTEINVRDVILKQYRYKLQAYLGVFTSLMFIQVLGMLFSFSGTSSMGGSAGTFSYDVRTYSGSLVAIFTLIWAFSNGISLTTKQHRYDDFNFIATRQVSNYANVLFLATASGIAAITGLLTTYVLRLLVTQVLRTPSIAVDQISVLDAFKGLVGFFLYILLFASVGYFIGMLAQTNKIAAFLLPVLLIVVISIQAYLGGEGDLLVDIGRFYVLEASFLLFTVKSIITSVLFFLGACMLGNRLEVGV
ncbi:hypothetical protein [Robertmurraya sp. P23]|uniref:hypothetical protein n=1 Tax=Robertmurraya sp. P23 TaxID=3436931 RepID=UPI003D99A34D